MTGVNDSPARAYLTSAQRGPTTARVVAEVLRDAAAKLDHLADADISDITLASAVHTRDETILTVYFDESTGPGFGR